MADLETLRHSRHALLDGFDEEGVAKLQSARALIIGAGGLGCPAATYLAASGIGTIEWVDGDSVDATNLARQTLFGPQDIGTPKVLAGAAALERINPDCKIIAVHAFADQAMLESSVRLADVVLDCTDQWASRQMINAQCMQHGVPLVSAAAIEWSGQLLSIDPRNASHACYACVFDPGSEPPAHACGAYGVLSPMVGAMGCLQAAEAMKIIIGAAAGGHAPQRLSILDMKSATWQQFTVARQPGCPVCAKRS
jgi:molybdopterin/thiamine biosynthesis adenylyltransferase